MSMSHPPFYFMYGEPVRDVGPSFVHVERVMDRGAFHHGHVEDHSHPHLHQLSFWPASHGRYDVDGNGHSLNGPALTWMPSGVIHGFHVTEASDSIVVSMSDDFVAECLGSLDLPQIRAILREPLVMPLPEEVALRLEPMFREMEREYRFPSWGQVAALDASIRLAFLTLARVVEVREAHGMAPGPEQRLFVRFLELLERHFRNHRSVDSYCAMLGTTPYLLNRATQAGSGLRASHVVRARIIQEAKRQLLYTGRDIGEVGFAMGFADAAHFGRMFKAATGLSPAQWRSRSRATDAIAPSPPSEAIGA